MKRILITGAAGFIGSNFVDYLRNIYENYELWVVDALTYAGSTDNLPADFLKENDGRARLFYGNICNGSMMNNLIGQVDAVVHFAAETHVTRSIHDNQGFFQTDVIGTQTVMNAAAAHRQTLKRVIHISTSEVYGTAESTAMTEDHPLNPRSPYAAAKCGGDRLVYSYIHSYDLPATIIRPFNVYGPRQHLEKLIPRLINSVLMNEPMPVHGDGMASRDFTFVTDLCRAIDNVLHAPSDRVIGEIFNVASGVDRSIIAIARDVAIAMGREDHAIRHLSDRPGQVDRHTGDAGKIKRVLGWSPQVTWVDGLRSTIDWYKANEAWWHRQLWLRSVPITLPNGAMEFH